MYAYEKHIKIAKELLEKAKYARNSVDPSSWHDREKLKVQQATQMTMEAQAHLDLAKLLRDES